MSTPFVGEIRIFSFPRIPYGWAACDGSLLQISNNQALFAVFGTTYGGDGVTTFGLPDLRGQAPLHQGAGSGLSTRVLGSTGGSETVTLNVSQMPQHTHAVNATANTASATTPGPTVVPGALGGTDTMYASTSAGATIDALASGAVSPQGGSLPHDNTMPTLTVSYCVALNGIFPSQN